MVEGAVRNLGKRKAEDTLKYRRSVIVPPILLIDDDPVGVAALAQRLRFAFRAQRLEVDVADSAASPGH